MSAILQMPQTVPNPLPLLQQQFALLKLGNQISVVELPQAGQTWADRGSVSRYKLVDAKILLHRALEIIPSAASASQIIADFYSSPSTTVYDEILFDPRPTTPTTINLWQQPTIAGTPGNFPTIEAFMLDVISSGNQVVNAYMVNFMAHMLKHPEIKPGVMPVLMGGQGTGKGTFFKLLRAIWSKTCLSTNQIDQVTGRFNNVLERNYVIWLDEALFVGNKAATDKLKSLITEQNITIEAKHETPRSIFSCHRFFAATNANQFAHIAHDDRRMLYLPIPDTYQGVTRYWNQINNAITSREVDAFVDHLWCRPIAGFNPASRPKSTALTAQKLKSLEGASAWWYDILYTGVICSEPFQNSPPIWISPDFFSTQTLTASYEGFARRHKHRPTAITERDLKETLNVLCPSAKDTRKQVNGRQSRGYDLPTRGKAQQDFEAYIDSKPNWPV